MERFKQTTVAAKKHRDEEYTYEDETNDDGKGPKVDGREEYNNNNENGDDDNDEDNLDNLDKVTFSTNKNDLQNLFTTSTSNTLLIPDTPVQERTFQTLSRITTTTSTIATIPSEQPTIIAEEITTTPIPFTSFPTLISTKEPTTSTILSRFTLSNNNNQFKERIIAPLFPPSPPNVQPPAENLEIPKFIFPPSLSPEPPGISTDLPIEPAQIRSENNGPNCGKY